MLKKLCFLRVHAVNAHIASAHPVATKACTHFVRELIVTFKLALHIQTGFS